MIEARLYEKEKNKKVRCLLCSHRCRIAPEKTGICGVRKNRDGILYAESFGKITAEAIDPIEKKPLNHFLPGTYSYSLGGMGCNFRCTHCQNWQISQPGDRTVRQSELMPDEAVSKALAGHCASISWTYNEPTIWHEYTLEMGKLARKNGIGTVYVTNGYMTEEAVDELSVMLNAFRVDIKAFSDEFYKKVCKARLQPVLDASVRAREIGMHIETVTLVIPGLNDSEEEMKALIKWVAENLGPETPMHFTRFHPDNLMMDRESTPLRTLEKIYEMAKEMGILYPYIGNVHSHPYENTYCPMCGATIIKRIGYSTQIADLDGDCCAKCGERIPIVTSVR